MLGNTTKMVFELWLRAKKLESCDHPSRASARRHEDACVDFLRQSQAIHGFAFSDETDNPENAGAQSTPKDAIRLNECGMLMRMRDEAANEKDRLEKDGDIIGATMMEAYFWYVQWLYDGWRALNRDPALKAIVKYLADRL